MSSKHALGVHVSLFSRALLQSLSDVFLYLLTYHLPRQVPSHGTNLFYTHIFGTPLAISTQMFPY